MTISSKEVSQFCSSDRIGALLFLEDGYSSKEISHFCSLYRIGALEFLVITSLGQDWVNYAPDTLLGCGCHLPGISQFTISQARNLTNPDPER